MSLEIEVLIDSLVDPSPDLDSLKRAATLAATLAAQWRGFSSGEIGIRVTDDATIHQINRKHLGHDYPTDVISFGYHADAPQIEGELIVSVDTARRRASELGWNADHELLLYIVHGVLHLTGMDDHAADDRSAMRMAEEGVMLELGVSEIMRFNVDLQGVDRAGVDRPAADSDRKSVTENQS